MTSTAATICSSIRPSSCALRPTTAQWCVILPAYNEQDNLPHVVEDVLSTFAELEIPCNILIVDDGSTDRTPQIADDYAARTDNIVVIHHPINLGVGEALKTGYHQACGDLAVLIPADRQFRCRDLKKCFHLLADHEVVCCVRRDRNDPPGRRVASFIYRILMRWLFGLKLDDINWVKVYHLSLLRRMTIESAGPFIDTEMLVKAARLGARIAQVDVPHYPRIAGRATGAGLRAVLKTFLDLIRLGLRLRRAQPSINETRRAS